MVVQGREGGCSIIYRHMFCSQPSGVKVIVLYFALSNGGMRPFGVGFCSMMVVAKVFRNADGRRQLPFRAVYVEQLWGLAQSG